MLLPGRIVLNTTSVQHGCRLCLHVRDTAAAANQGTRPPIRWQLGEPPPDSSSHFAAGSGKLPVMQHASWVWWQSAMSMSIDFGGRVASDVPFARNGKLACGRWLQLSLPFLLAMLENVCSSNLNLLR